MSPRGLTILTGDDPMLGYSEPAAPPRAQTALSRTEGQAAQETPTREELEALKFGSSEELLARLQQRDA